ncbi:Na+/H+ antiporter subunit E [Rhizobium sp. EC-SD404]|uniref:Na+/H+ antiporter subunit E n=1 Tax=Rhizobium sp. EC-SD404 TaxID=2038389 RepID=UPI001256E113|nr:Na+/H+ antiporter subunit E [Rhizobium sp. EC-SD404]VVT13929.1 Na(+)/H(+) antiporter subunit E [Rhizobium sp. EC-SD404]
MKLFLANILLAFAWGAVSGSLSELNLAFGFVLGFLALMLIREQVGSLSYVTRVKRILALLALFLKELALSAWKVAVLVASPKLDVKPGILALPLDVDRDGEITLLANLITLTPGTLSIDVSDDHKTLFIHAIDCSDPDGIRRDIKEGFERRIMEAFR